jgi:hypothetical protein
VSQNSVRIDGQGRDRNVKYVGQIDIDQTTKVKKFEKIPNDRVASNFAGAGIRGSNHIFG